MSTYPRFIGGLFAIVLASSYAYLPMAGVTEDTNVARLILCGMGIAVLFSLIASPRFWGLSVRRRGWGIAVVLMLLIALGFRIDAWTSERRAAHQVELQRQSVPSEHRSRIEFEGGKFEENDTGLVVADPNADVKFKDTDFIKNGVGVVRVPAPTPKPNATPPRKDRVLLDIDHSPWIPSRESLGSNKKPSGEGERALKAGIAG
jgi:hypothetical protein